MISTLLVAGTAHAQQPAPNTAADNALAEGRRLYDLQEWDLAIARFKEAYRLRADAPALFNIAQSYRLKGDCANAASFYKTFKRNFPGEKNIAKVEKFIAEMEACAKASGRTTEPARSDPARPDPGRVDASRPDPRTTDPRTTDPRTDPATGETSATPVMTSPDDSTPDGTGAGVSARTGDGDASAEGGGGGMKLAGLGVAGVGVVSLGVGVMFALRASSAASDAEGLGQDAIWDPEIETRGEKAAKNAKLFLVVGGAAVVTGGVLYFLGAKQSSERSSVTLVPTGDGASVAWACAF